MKPRKGANYACYLAIPKVSSEKRRYIPMGFMNPDVLCSDLLFILRDATLFQFGVMTSNVHMAWMRAVAGRLKSDYRYSVGIVYNNFPWPTTTPEQKQRIEASAQNILKARQLCFERDPKATLANLYDYDYLMPKELLRAHRQNDHNVMQAYGFKPNIQEPEAVRNLMELYNTMCAAEGMQDK